uniref:ATP synthase F0 subunit 8 n=1 Tax=Janus sp. 1 GYN-2022e TaxID=3003421 RepID=A0A9E8Z511_9HYME|nr:ATP synthase F0 subunit 8 [Janus sp. 1 GYN-2022e]
MPQMSPMNWLILLLMFTLMLLSTISLIYFSYKMTPKKTMKYIKNQINIPKWKW